jgi:hypothetical protein
MRVLVVAVCVSALQAAGGCGDGGASSGLDSGVAADMLRGGAAATVTLTADPAPVVAAYQDGEGPWQTIVPVEGRLQFQVSQPRYRLAYLCRLYGLDQHAYVLQATPGQTTRTVTSCSREQQLDDVHSWTFNLTGAPAGAKFSLNAGNTRASRRFDGQEDAYKVSLSAGENTVIAAAVGSDGEVRVVISRFTVSGPGSLGVDFSPATTIVPLRDIVLTNPVAGERVFGSLIIRAGTTGLYLSSPLFVGKVPVLDPTRLSGEDAQSVTVSVAGADRSGSVNRKLIGGELGVFTMPPSVPVRVQLLQGNFPPHRPRIIFGSPVAWADLHSSQITSLVGYPLSVRMDVTQASLLGGLEFEFPELSQVLGLDSAWEKSMVPGTVQVVSTRNSGDQVDSSGRFVKPDPM